MNLMDCDEVEDIFEDENDYVPQLRNIFICPEADDRLEFGVPDDEVDAVDSGLHKFVDKLQWKITEVAQNLYADATKVDLFR
mmetsp:Transcript_3982/g.6812  ORF Transcript_3982/g.6812 Transcript_3982/m.6812 type:complete len:82 (-) Transcript_3982:37-282(-)